MIRIAICDSSQDEIDKLVKLLELYFSVRPYEYEVFSYTKGENLLYEYEDNKQLFSLLFLDANLPDLKGGELFEKIRKVDEQVRFIALAQTEEFALEAFWYFAFGYLLKPLKSENLAHFMNRFMKQENLSRKKSLLVKEGSSNRRISYSDILYLESNNKTINIYLKDKTHYVIYAKLKDVENELKGRSFLRCHQSYIVNLDHVMSIENADFYTILGNTVPIRKKEVKKMREYYISYIKLKQ